MPKDSSAVPDGRKNRIAVTADKIANVFTFNGTADLLFNGGWGELSIIQAYKGNSINTYNTVVKDSITFTIPFTTIRDDEDLTLKYSYPFNDWFALMLNQRTVISSDNISAGINDLQRINSQIGIILKSGKNLYINVSGGLEDNKSLGIKTGGKVFGLNGYARNLDIFDIMSNSTVTGELLQFNDERVYADLNFKADAVKQYENNGLIGMSLNYKKQNRDMIAPRYISGRSYPFESRLDDKIGADLRIGFQLLDPVYSSLAISVYNQSVERFYNRPVTSLDLSYVRKNHNEFMISFSGSMDFNIERFSESLSLSYDSRENKNKITDKYGLEELKITSLRTLDYQNDFLETTTRLASRTIWEVAAKDTVNVYYNMSLNRYDTPSDENDDEYDQFNAFFRAIYRKYFSENFNAAFTAELHMAHLVKLKSSLSAGNNWIRVIKLGPEFRWQTKYFSVSPRFEILASYTVYDYEDIAVSIRSRSMRQVAYRDTVSVPLAKGYSILSGIVLKYYEYAQLLWDAFSEAPQSSNFEQFYKLMLVRNFSKTNYAGFGLRYYNFTSRNIGNNRSSPVLGSSPVESYGLETTINFSLFNNSNISLQGWYEFQKVNNKEFKTFPNFFILTIIYL